MLTYLKKYIRQSNNVHSLAGNLIFALFSFITFFLMVRFLSKELYGRWILYITMVALLDMLRFGLTSTGAIRLISTTEGTAQKRNIAASYHLAFITTFIIALIFIPSYFIFHSSYADSYYFPVLLFYPILALVNLPYYQAQTLNQGIIDFKRIMVLKTINGLINLVLVVLYIVIFEESIQGIIIANIIANLITSVSAMIMKWDGWQFFAYFHKPSIMKILKFGKYSTASSIGSNLLRSSDTFILSLSATMGATAVAVYAIPLKLVELIEIPLRSFSSTAFPKLSKAWKVNKTGFNILMGRYLTLTSLVLIPVIIVILLNAGYFLSFIGGPEYSDSIKLQKNILYIISIYIFLLPYDRYSGVALFAINNPGKNFLKIIIMLFANIILDLIAVFVFESLVMVAIATVLFTFMGILIGWYFIFKESGFSFRSIPKMVLKNIFYNFTIIKALIINGKSSAKY